MDLDYSRGDPRFGSQGGPIHPMVGENWEMYLSELNACLACMRSWVQFLGLHKQGTVTNAYNSGILEVQAGI